MKSVSKITLLLALAAVSNNHAAWQKLPPLSKRVVETATSAVKGAKVQSSQGIGQADALLSDDPTVAATLPVGVSEAVLNLASQRVVEAVLFVNDSVEGKVVISGSADMKNWTPSGQAVFTAADRQVEVAFAGSQMKYLKVHFELSKGGVIRNFQLFGTDSDQDFQVKQSPSGQGGVKLNLAGGMGGSRVIYVHPSPSKGSDVTEVGRAQSKFDFPESNEKYRTIIYDLGSPRLLSEFGSVHSPRPVRFEVFTFDQLPEKEDWRGRMSFDPKAFDTATPVASKEDPQGTGYIKVKTQKPVRARYVALRWQPDFNPPPFSVSGINVSGGGFNVTNRSGGGNGSNQGGGGGNGESGNGGNNGTDGSAPPANQYANTGGMSPFGYGTGGYAGGGGSLPPSSSNGNANGNANGNSNGNANGNANGNSNGTPVGSP